MEDVREKALADVDFMKLCDVVPSRSMAAQC